MPVSRPADERFGGMSSLDAIIERLREQACGPDEYRHWNYVEAVTVEQAEAAVLAAGDARTAEIEAWLRADGHWRLRDVADSLARRFPNGGTNDGK